MIVDVPGCEAYTDDVIIYSEKWNSHLCQIQKFFDNLEAVNLTVHLSKSVFGHTQVSFFGYVIGGGEIKPITAKVDSVNHFQFFITKELIRFLGTAGYYR